MAPTVSAMAEEQALPDYIHQPVKDLLSECGNNEFLDLRHLDQLLLVIHSQDLEIRKIWQTVDKAHSPLNSDTPDSSDLSNQPGDGQQWLCRSILFSIPESAFMATTRKEAEQWQQTTSEKIHALELKLDDLPESCSRLPMVFAEHSLDRMDSDQSWRGREELLEYPRALCTLFCRYRILLQLLKESVTDPCLIPEDHDFEIRPNSPTTERNQFMRTLSQEFKAALGENKTIWVAIIASAIYGGDPDPKEVRRQLAC
jgi:hypothetical protein